KVGATDVQPTSWSSDGDSLFIDHELPGKTDVDIYVYSFRTQTLKPFIATPFTEQSGTVSPDSSLFAYVSNESGQPEVYVARYPSLADRRQVSNGGGQNPHWRSDSRELFFVSSAEMLTSVDITSSDAMPQPLL